MELQDQIDNSPKCKRVCPLTGACLFLPFASEPHRIAQINFFRQHFSKIFPMPKYVKYRNESHCNSEFNMKK